MSAARFALVAVLVVAGCGGAGDTHLEKPDPPACTPETDAQLCTAAAAQCGTISAQDRCGETRSLDCGTCGAHASCDPTAMACVCDTGFSGNGEGCTTAIGASCSNGNGTQQNCPNGQVCQSSQGLNLCNLPTCAMDSDCGTNGAIANSCGATTNGLQCQLNCLPSQPNSCGNPELVCLPASASDTSDTSQCVINCTLEPSSWCQNQIYGGVCQSDGLCRANPCNSDGSCSSGWVCDSSQPTAAVQQYCVPDCRVSGNSCPSSAVTCDSSNGVCDIAAS